MKYTRTDNSVDTAFDDADFARLGWSSVKTHGPKITRFMAVDVDRHAVAPTVKVRPGRNCRRVSTHRNPAGDLFAKLSLMLAALSVLVGSVFYIQSGVVTTGGGNGAGIHAAK